RDGGVALRAAPEKRLPWKRLCGHLGESLVERVERKPTYEGYVSQTAGCQFAQALVDPETGSVRVERVVAVQDCGIPLNRLTCESQIIGGVIQGVSYALLEERVVDHRSGKMVNANLEQYKIAGSVDVPVIEPIL